MKYRNYMFLTILIFLSLWMSACSSNSLVSKEPKIKHNTYLEGENLKGLKKSQVLEKLNTHASRINMLALDAKLKTTDWQIQNPEKVGKRVNIEKTMEDIFNSGDGIHIQLAMEEIQPKVTSTELKKNIHVIGSYTTRILDQKPSRISNIEIAAEWITNETVMPGEEFSFNGVVGRRTKEKGYEKAPIIIRTEKGPKKSAGIGGGICQLSTTLYNAADKAGMKITERHTHSKPVGYVPLGRDATVSDKYTDFKFVNNRHYPIMIKSYIQADELTVNILENRNAKRLE